MENNFSIYNNLFIYGNSGIASEIAELLIGKGVIVSGFVLDNEYIKENLFDNSSLNIPIISYDDYISDERNRHIPLIISLGEPKYRKQLSLKINHEGLVETGINLADFVSSSAIIGKGTILHYGSFVSSNSSLGNSCLINKMSIVGHDCVIGDYTVVSPRVTIGGKVSIGEGCFLGLGAVIRDRVKIGNNCVVGMGAVVTKDVEDNSIVVGNPATFLKSNNEGIIFKHK